MAAATPVAFPQYLFSFLHGKDGVDAMPKVYSTNDVAKLFRVPAWQIRRLYEVGALPEPPMAGGRRMIDESQLPEIIEALRRRNWWRGTDGKISNSTSNLALV